VFGFGYVEEPVELSSAAIGAYGVDAAFPGPFGDGADGYAAVCGGLGGGDFRFNDFLWGEDCCIWQRFDGLSGIQKTPAWRGQVWGVSEYWHSSANQLRLYQYSSNFTMALEGLFL
jgi:hypothetical protein